MMGNKKPEETKQRWWGEGGKRKKYPNPVNNCQT